jgi:hypothetical protein
MDADIEADFAAALDDLLAALENANAAITALRGDDDPVDESEITAAQIEHATVLMDPNRRTLVRVVLDMIADLDGDGAVLGAWGEHTTGEIEP